MNPLQANLLTSLLPRLCSGGGQQETSGLPSRMVVKKVITEEPARGNGLSIAGPTLELGPP